jgi:hypothetical protein
VIEVEAKTEKKEYLIRKKELIDKLIDSLKQLAKNRKAGMCHLLRALFGLTG